MKRMKRFISLVLAVFLLLSQSVAAHAAWYDDAYNWGKGAIEDVKDVGKIALNWTVNAAYDAFDWGKGAIDDIDEISDVIIDDVVEVAGDIAVFSGELSKDAFAWTKGAINDIEEVLDSILDSLSLENPELSEMDFLPRITVDLNEFDNIYTGNNKDFEYIDNVKTKRLPKKAKDELYKKLRDFNLTDYWAKWVIKKAEGAGELSPGSMIADMLPISFLYGDKLAGAIDDTILDYGLEDIQPKVDGIAPDSLVNGMTFKYKHPNPPSGASFVIISGLNYGRRDDMYVIINAGGQKYEAEKRVLNEKEVVYTAMIHDLTGLEVTFENKFDNPPDVAMEVAKGIQDAINFFGKPFGKKPISDGARDDIRDYINELTVVTKSKKKDKDGNTVKEEYNKHSVNEVLGDGDIGVILSKPITGIPGIGTVLSLTGLDNKLAGVIRDAVGQVEVKSYAKLKKDAKISIKSYDNYMEMSKGVSKFTAMPAMSMSDYIDPKDFNLDFGKEADNKYSPSTQNASNWAINELDQAKSLGVYKAYNLFDDYKRNITREEFARLVVDLYEAYVGKPMIPASSATFDDTREPDVLKAYQALIINGNGKGSFEPNKPVTREQMAIMITKCTQAIYKSLDKSLNANGYGLTMTDKNKVSNWAKDYVAYANGIGIIKGSNNIFDPQGTTTVEQAVIIVKRMYEKIVQWNGSNKFALVDNVTRKNYSKIAVINGKFENVNGYLNMSLEDNKTEQLGIPVGADNKPGIYGDGVYTAKLNFKDEESSGAGIMFSAFNVQDKSSFPYGYYLFISPKYNNIGFNRQYKDTKELKNIKLDFDVIPNQDYTLKVVKKYPRIDIYVNNKKYISVSDNYFKKEALFGIVGFNSNVVYKEISFSSMTQAETPISFNTYHTDSFDPRRKNDYKTCTNFIPFGGEWEVGDTLSVKPNHESTGPLAIMLDENNKPLLGYDGWYSTKMTIKKTSHDSGNAGFVFNVFAPEKGNDQYIGYYVGLAPNKDEVIIGRSVREWEHLKSGKLPFDLKLGQEVELKVRFNNGRNGYSTWITVFVNGEKVLGTGLNSFFKDPKTGEYIKGAYGVRTWQAEAEYKYFIGQTFDESILK